MTTNNNFTLTTEQRRHRTFSEAFKRLKVSQVEANQITISQLSRDYQITRLTVYNWINKYGRSKEKPVRLVIEMDSDAKKLKEALKEIEDLKKLIGEQAILLKFKDKVLEIIEEEDHIDLKKKSERLRSGSGKTKKN